MIIVLNMLTTIMWKNYVLRKRHWCVSLIELLFPCLTVVLLLVVHVYLQSILSKGSNEAPPDQIEEPYPLVPELCECEDFNERRCVIMYAPRTSFAHNIMNKTREILMEQVRQSTIRYTGNDSLFDKTTFPEFKSTDSEGQLNDIYHKLMMNDIPHRFFGIVFESEENDKRFQYKIRTGSRNSVGDFPSSLLIGGDVYLTTCFLFLQKILDSVYIETITGKPFVNPEILMSRFPRPQSHSMDNTAYLVILVLTVMFSFFVSIPNLITALVSEKESGARELMKMMGLRTWMIWAGWLVYANMVNIFVVTFTAVIVTGQFKDYAPPLIPHTNPIFVWLILFLFMNATTILIFIVCAFFHRPLIALCFGVCLYFGPEFILGAQTLQKYLPPKLFLCMVPTHTVLVGFTTISKFNLRGGGAQFSNLFKSPSDSKKDPPLGEVYLMLVLDIFIFVLITWYIDNVRPGPYGRAKPWYFVFTMRFRKKTNNDMPIAHRHYENDDTEHFEKPPAHLKVGLSIRDLTKFFPPDIRAVNGVNIDIYKGQITALLGHNGAGKTTTMSMISGMFSPTSGAVYLHVSDTKTINIFDEMDTFRQDLGLCPQYNMHFSYLTVLEHLILFGMLKGMPKRMAIKDGLELLITLNMVEKQNMPANKLSGGMQRKLSLAISLISSPAVLMLDEPTSGMDPESRREMWDILLSIREGRTIIITTHFMEEADVLGDRIAIMDHGIIKCYGTTMFLKNVYGAGYTMTLLIIPHAKVQTITSLVTSLVPDSKLKSYNQGQLVYNLPSERSSNFGLLFAELEKKKASLLITGIGVSCTTMEDVFLKVGEITESYTNKQVDAININAQANNMNRAGHELKESGSVNQQVAETGKNPDDDNINSSELNKEVSLNEQGNESSDVPEKADMNSSSRHERDPIEMVSSNTLVPTTSNNPQDNADRLSRTERELKETGSLKINVQETSNNPLVDNTDLSSRSEREPSKVVSSNQQADETNYNAQDQNTNRSPRNERELNEMVSSNQQVDKTSNNLQEDDMKRSSRTEDEPNETVSSNPKVHETSNNPEENTDMSSRIEGDLNETVSSNQQVGETNNNPQEGNSDRSPETEHETNKTASSTQQVGKTSNNPQEDTSDKLPESERKPNKSAYSNQQVGETSNNPQEDNTDKSTETEREPNKSAYSNHQVGETSNNPQEGNTDKSPETEREPNKTASSNQQVGETSNNPKEDNTDKLPETEREPNKTASSNQQVDEFSEIPEESHTNEPLRSEWESLGGNTLLTHPDLDFELTKMKGMSLICNQFKVLLLKKIRIACRNICGLILSILLPLLMVGLGVWSILSSDNVAVKYKLTMDLYKGTEVFITYTHDRDAIRYKDIYVALITTSKVYSLSNTNISAELLGIGKENMVRFQEKLVVAADFTQNRTTCMYSNQHSAVHAPPISLNLITNTILKSYGTDYSITVFNHPFIEREHNVCVPGIGSNDLALAAWSFLVPFGFLFIMASFIAFPMCERINGAKHLQLMTGVSPILYWLSSFIWDYIYFFFTTFFLSIVIFILDKEHVISNSKAILVFLVIINLYGISGILYVYFFSFLRKSSSGVSGYFIFYNILFLIVGGMYVRVFIPLFKMVAAIGDSTSLKVLNKINLILMLNPFYCLVNALSRFIANSLEIYGCKLCLAQYHNDISAFADINRELNCEDDKSYFAFHYKDSNAIGVMAVMFLLSTLLFAVIILLIEYGMIEKFVNICRTMTIEGRARNLDSDVQLELKRVNSAKTKRHKPLTADSPVLIVDNLRKVYDNGFVGVRGVSFTVKSAECFGLLGVNGAGKTTTFKMLTGELSPTEGNASITTYSLADDRSKYLQQIGYCPQFDAINEVLTGREMLQLFGQLKGFGAKDSEVVTNYWLKYMGLEEYSERRCGTYSGGNKRKLSTAMALIGSPLLVFLDEPTSGVDPVARRKLWRVLANCQEAGQSIVLTSHSMDECEALCSRLTIMVTGRMVCIGSVEYLKQKFGQGYTIMVKLTFDQVPDLIERRELKQDIEKTFAPNCLLKDEHSGMLHYHVTDNTKTWSMLFISMEEIKSKYAKLVEDYSISESTLEQVFISFAKHV